MKITIGTFQSLKQEVSLLCPLSRFEATLKRVKLGLKFVHREEEFIIEETCSRLQEEINGAINERGFYTHEFPPANKRMTLIDRSIFSGENTLIMNLWWILAQELTGTAKDYVPFWNEAIREKSQKLWLPTETDLPDLPLNCSKTSWECMEQKSCFSPQRMMNDQKTDWSMTYSPLFTSTAVETSEEEGTKSKRKVKSKKKPKQMYVMRKTRIYPTRDQKKTLTGWFGTCRYVYNLVLNKMNDGTIITKTNDKAICMQIIPKDRGILPEWSLATPSEVKRAAVRDLTRGFKAIFTQLEMGMIRHAEMKRRTRKEVQSLEVPKTGIRWGEEDRPEIIIYEKFLGTMKISKRDSKKLKRSRVEFCDSRIQLKRGKWYLLLPILPPTSARKCKYGIVTLDPGIRTFQTAFSKEEIVKFQHRRELIKELHKKIDERRKTGACRREQKLWDRLENIVDEMHFKTINYLTDYEHIYCPEFKIQSIAKKGKLRPPTVREMYSLSHFKFRSRLEAKCKVLGTTFILCNESFTSQTCTKCGNVRKPSTDTYYCPLCKLTFDRDVMAARNIFLKYTKCA